MAEKAYHKRAVFCYTPLTRLDGIKAVVYRARTRSHEAPKLLTTQLEVTVASRASEKCCVLSIIPSLLKNS